MMRKLLLISTFVSVSALGALAQAINIPNGFDLGRYRDAVMGAESSGNYSVMNRNTGAAGAYQFMPVALADVGYVAGSGRGWDNWSFTTAAQAQGVNSIDDFLNTPAGHALQDRAFSEFTQKLWTGLGQARSHVGRVVNGITITEGGLLSGAHFLGAAGMRQFVLDGYTSANMRNLDLILRQNGFSSVADLDAYVMRRIREGAAAHGDQPTAPSGEELGLSCFQVPIIDQAGEAVSSPFGVDRSNRKGASGGYHVGLDIVNGDRASRRGNPMVAGLEGKVINANVGTVRGVTIQTNDGLMQYAYLHNDTVRVRQGDEVAVGDLVATMGDAGSPGAVHLHLMVALRADVVQAAGESIGKVWSLGNGFGSKRAPLSAGAIPTDSNTYLVVNPETFLHHRIPFQAGLLEAYASQGLNRPDGLTLEPTCGPTTEMLSNAGIAASTNGGTTMDGATGFGTQLINSSQVITAMATEEGRDAMIEYGASAYQQLSRQSHDMGSDRMRAATWAAVGAAYNFNRNY